MMVSDEGIARFQWSGIGPDAPVQNADQLGSSGYLQDCDGGTIFIDEVAELPYWFQTYLLQILDHAEMRPTASGKGKPFTPNVRLILATNADLLARVEEGSFRKDLYRRIVSRTVKIPPLKERKEDILLFVRDYLGERKEGERKVAPKFMLALLRHDWEEGNVGELLATIKLAVDRTSRKAEPLTLELIPNFPTFAEIRELGTDQCEVELYRMLCEILEAQGVERGKGLHLQIGKILGFSPPWVSALAKRVGQ
jgi:DNA-binding NtrC family response regulator